MRVQVKFKVSNCLKECVLWLEDGKINIFRIPGEVRDDGEETYFWVFESSGICEPIGVKLISEVEGYEGMITMDFNPLTAQTQETLTKTTVLGAENIDELE